MEGAGRRAQGPDAAAARLHAARVWLHHVPGRQPGGCPGNLDGYLGQGLSADGAVPHAAHDEHRNGPAEMEGAGAARGRPVGGERHRAAQFEAVPPHNRPVDAGHHVADQQSAGFG